MNYKDICESVATLARQTGKRLLQYRAENAVVVETKGHNDFVTQMDKYTEGLLVEGLDKILPEAGYIAEEGTRVDNGEEYKWIVDPIDGTTNFIHLMPPYAISIALMHKGTIVVGVVYEMGHDELFTAWLGGGSYLNGEPIHVTQAPTVSHSLVATGFPYNEFSRMDNYMQTLTHFMKYSQGVRRIGSAATDMAYVAAGRFEVFYEYDLKSYDVAAGAILITEAGGKVSDFKGGDNYIFGREIVATNGHVHEECINITKSI
jgi:myo-inositol-1(or 4)-monophosphatase